MRFFITMNMPAFEGNLIHQLIVEVHGVDSLKGLQDMMNREEFIMGHHWYRRKNMYTGKDEWLERGDIIVNTAHIGKVVEFIEMEDRSGEEGYRSGASARVVNQGPRRPMRP
jgi:hypothetical protein